MQKSIFQKYFTVFAALLICVMMILGGVLMAFAANYFRNERYQLLSENAGRAAEVILRDYRRNDDGTVSVSVVTPTFSVLAQAIDADFFFVHTNGRCELCTEQQPCVHMSYTVPEEILSAAQSGVFRETGKLGGIYQAAHYTVGVPVTENGSVLGYVFASTDTRALTNFLGSLSRMFLLSAILVLLIAFVVLYFVTLRLVRPLRDMSVAAHRFGEGDFSVRLQIADNDEIGQLARSLNRMAESLAVLEQTHHSFTSNVSHELRTPMTSIAGFIDGILDGTIPPQEHKKYLRIVSDEVRRLSRLVRSMLDLSRLEAGELQIKPTVFNAVEVICQTVFSFEKRIEEKGITMTGLDHEPVMVKADQDLIHQVLYNLMENAVKFTNENGEISVSFGADGNRTRIAVRNTGAGLSRDEVAQVFNRFYKADRSRGQDTSGAGLGLYIARSIVRLHGGEIRVVSEEGKYTEFSFTLPTEKNTRRYRDGGEQQA